jgi:Zn-dependent metalloprotease
MIPIPNQEKSIMSRFIGWPAWVVAGLLPFCALAGEPPAPRLARIADVYKAPEGLLEHVEGRLSEAAPELSPSEAALRFLRDNPELLPGKGVEELEIQRTDEATVPGITHVLLRQRYNGLPLYNSHLVVSMHGDDKRVFRAWGKLSRIPWDFRTTPALSPAEAEQKARAVSGLEDAQLQEPIQLLILANLPREHEFHLAYKVHLLSRRLPITRNEILFLDAVTGRAVHVENLVHAATGVGVFGNARTLNATSLGATYVLRDTTRPMYNVLTGKGVIETYKQGPGAGALLSDDVDAIWNAPSQGAEVDAHYYTGLAYSYYQSQHNRNSVDNQGMSILSYTHLPESNAFWDGTGALYGDGDFATNPATGNFFNFAGDFSIVGHELTHGVIQFGANLLYQGESGALNEAYADAMSKLGIDPDNWLIGDQVITPYFKSTHGGMDAARSMQDPQFTYVGLSYNPSSPRSGPQPDHMNLYTPLPATTDDGGVHVNSGIVNKFTYLVSEGGTFHGVSVVGIGRQNTAKLYYLVNNPFYLTTTATFSEFVAGLKKVVNDFYGNDVVKKTAMLAALNSAAQAVGILPAPQQFTETEPNNQPSTSSAHLISVNGTDVTGFMSYSTDIDYYRIVVPPNMTLVGVLKPPSATDLNLLLNDGIVQLAKSATPGAGMPEQIQVKNTTAANKTYYLGVNRFNGSYSATQHAYKLNISWQ